MTQLRIRVPTSHGQVEIEADLDDAALHRVLVDIIRHPESLSISSRTPGEGARQDIQSAPGRTPPLGDMQASKLRERLPSVADIAAFIRNRPSRSHSLREVSTHFLGVHVRGNSPSREEKQLFWRIQDRAIAARKLIEREDRSGKFVSDNVRRVGHSHVYTWRVE